MKARSGFLGSIVVLLFSIVISAAAQTAKPAATSHQQTADAAARKQFVADMTGFRTNPDDAELREKIIELAKALKPAPPIPQAARADFVKATSQLKNATTTDDFNAAAKLFERVAVQAPWYADAYLNAASAYAKAGNFDDAERNLVLHVTAARPGTDTTVAEGLQHEIDRQRIQQRFQQALQEFQKNPSESAREGIVKLAQQVQPPPEIPEEARQRYAKAKALSDGAKKPEDFNVSIAEFNNAILIAPWWPDPVTGIASTQAAARQFDFQLLLEQLRRTTRYSQEDLGVRQKIIEMVRAMHTPPAISDDVMRAMVRGETLVKMGGEGSYAEAATEMEKAVLAAPWSADGYFNLAVVQERAEQFPQAMQNLQLCVLSAPDAQNVPAIKAKIYELEIMQEDKAKTQGLRGTWNMQGGGTIFVAVDGNKISIGNSFAVVKKGRALEGTISINGHQEYWNNDGRTSPCVVPGETVPITGVLSEDGRSIDFTWMQSSYSTAYNDKEVCSLCDAGRIHCTGVALSGKTERHWKITR